MIGDSTRRTYIIWLLCLLCCCTTGIAAKDKTVKKKGAVIVTPEPDAMVYASKVQKSLPDQPEADSPNFVDLRFKEGIDVSHYQHEIDWKSVAKDGQIGYAYMKATEGASLVDDTYEYNIREARKAGLKVGSYHFFRAHISLDEQFNNMTSTVKKDMQDLIPIVDVEHTNGCSSAELVRRLKIFLERLTAYYGRKPMLYTFVNFYNKHFAGAGLDEYPLMIAFYRDAQPELSDGRKYVIWQYTSHGDVPGVDGNVDRSIMMEGFSLKDIRYK